MFPVDLSIGILCQPDDWYINDVIRSISSVTNQMDEQTTVKTYVIFVGILSTDPDDVARVKQKFSESSDMKNVEPTFIEVSKELLSERVESPDIPAALYLDSKELVELRTHVNMLLSVIFWHASQMSDYFLLTDAAFTLNKGALIGMISEFARKGGVSELLRLKDAKVKGICGALYGGGRELEALAGYMYWLSPFQDTSKLVLYYEHLYHSHGRINTDKPMFYNMVSSQPRVMVENNPVAMITTNMTVSQEYFPTNPYDRNELFWSSTAIEGSFIIIKFVQSEHIKRIRIDTGTDIYMSDVLTKAVLEEANNYSGDYCGKFRRIADFRSSRIKVDLTKRHLKTSCLRIRLIADEGHWVGIRMIQVVTS